MKSCHFAGVSSSVKIASTGQAGTHAPQSMHSSGWMYSISAVSKSASSFRGWIQSTGQTSTHAVSFVPMQGSQMIYATASSLMILKKTVRVLWATGAAVVLMSAANGAQDGRPLQSNCDGVWRALFTPPHPALGRYEA